MFRLKLGIAIGYGLGWLVASGKAAELLDRYRRRRDATSFGASSPLVADSSGVYDFAVRVTD